MTRGTSGGCPWTIVHTALIRGNLAGVYTCKQPGSVRSSAGVTARLDVAERVRLCATCGVVLSLPVVLQSSAVHGLDGRCHLLESAVRGGRDG